MMRLALLVLFCLLVLILPLATQGGVGGWFSWPGFGDGDWHRQVLPFADAGQPTLPIPREFVDITPVYGGKPTPELGDEAELRLIERTLRKRLRREGKLPGRLTLP